MNNSITIIPFPMFKITAIEAHLLLEAEKILINRLKEWTKQPRYGYLLCFAIPNSLELKEECRKLRDKISLVLKHKGDLKSYLLTCNNISYGYHEGKLVDYNGQPYLLRLCWIDALLMYNGYRFTSANS